MLEKLGFDSIEKKIFNADLPVLLACLHNGDGYMKQKKMLEEAALRLSYTVRMYIVKDEVLKFIRNAYDVPGTPTYIVLKKGSEVDRLLGQTDVETLVSFVGNAAVNMTSCKDVSGDR